MHHSIVYKRPGHYVIGPVPRLMPDGRLAVLVLVSPFADHYGGTNASSLTPPSGRKLSR